MTRTIGDEDGGSSGEGIPSDEAPDEEMGDNLEGLDVTLGFRR